MRSLEVLHAIVIVFVVSTAWSQVELLATENRIEISNAVQKVSFVKTEPKNPIRPARFGNAVVFWGDAREKLIIPALESFNSTQLTIELWVRLSPISAKQVIIARGLTRTPGHWEVFASRNNGRVGYYIPDLNPASAESNVSITDDHWHFLSLKIRPGQVTLALDGAVVIDNKTTGQIAASLQSIVVGALPDEETSDQFPMTGLIDDLRLSSVYRTSMIVPSKPLKGDANTIGLYHFDSVEKNNACPDEGGPYQIAIPALFVPGAGAVGPGKFAQAAVFQGNSANKLTIRTLPQSSLPEQTVEFWVKLAPSQNHQVIIAKGIKTTSHWEVYAREKTGNVSYYIPGVNPAEAVSGVSITDNQWHFVSLRMKPGRVMIAVDGRYAIDQAVTGAISPSDAPVYVGSLSDKDLSPPFPITGAVDDLRLSNVYRPSVAVPTQPLPADENSIGLYRFDVPIGNTFPSETHVKVDSNPARLPSQREGFELITYIKKGSTWEPLFDAGSPLVEGSQFDLMPTRYQIVENSPKRKAVLFRGEQGALGYNWDALVEAKNDSPLIHVLVTCHLTSNLTVDAPQPMARLWMKKHCVEVELNQGPGSIYVGAAENGWGNAFPAAYLWTEGKEAAFFAQMTKLTWMERNRFNRTYRVQAAPHAGKYALGLWALQVTRNPIPAGDRVVADYYLYAAVRPEQPSRLQALDTMVNVFGEVHPANSTFPVNQKGGPTNWTYFASKMTGNLMVKDVGGNPGAIWDDVEFSPPWDDGLTSPVSVVRVSSDYALKSGCHPAVWRTSVATMWDFSTTNNYVAPWIGIERLNPDQRQREFLKYKVANLPLFYDPKARLIRHGTRHPEHVGDFEMSWQNFTFSLETMKVYEMLAPEQFNPAIGGRFLMSTEGLMELAHNVNYIFPQWFDPYKKVPIAQQDAPALGIVYEPWQVGTYAYLMTLAYGMTRQSSYLDEARKSMDTLLTDMAYSVTNERYSMTYTDPVDFPITEIFGNGWGIAAGQAVYNLTGDEKYLRYSKEFLNSLLRATFWYESELEVDPIDRILKNAGLFEAFHHYLGAAPWETIEAYLPMTIMLKYDNPYAPLQLMMRLFNTMRINSFWFFPPVFRGAAVTCQELIDSPADYISIENLHMPERGGGHGGLGRAIYMSQIALWNYLLFEAFAVASNQEIMVLNLDVIDSFEEAVTSAERQFYIFNPTEEAKEFELLLKSLRPGKYTVTIKDSSGKVSKRTCTDSQLTAGVPLTLGSLDYMKVVLQHENADSMKAAIQQCKTAQDKISYAYQLLQESARDRGVTDIFLKLKQQFKQSKRAYDRQQYDEATSTAQRIIEALESQGEKLKAK